MKEAMSVLDSDNPRQSKLRLTHVLFIAAVMAYLLSCFYVWFAAWRSSPDLRARSLINALREYRVEHRRWPENIEDLRDSTSLKLGSEAGVGSDGRSLRWRNYLYVYTPFGELVSLWAVPLGPWRAEAETHYVVVGAKDLVDWVGPALRDDQLQYVVGDPGEWRLALLGMKKRDSQSDQKQKQAEKGSRDGHDQPVQAVNNGSKK